VAGALFLAALVASCFLGAFPPVDLRAVCLVRAISMMNNIKKTAKTLFLYRAAAGVWCASCYWATKAGQRLVEKVDSSLVISDPSLTQNRQRKQRDVEVDATTFQMDVRPCRLSLLDVFVYRNHERT